MSEARGGGDLGVTGRAALDPAAFAPAPVRRPRPPGQRLYDMPYSAVAPRLVNPALGLRNLVARAGDNAAYEIDVTLLDAPDHRLARSGVLLAHRVLDGRGEWYLTAPDWQPLLPKDRIELMGHADLPEQLTDLIRPLRRRAPLGPVAALRCDRREFALRDDDGVTVALLRDDKVTVRRGGLTTARYREVMLTPVGPGLTEEQTAWLDGALVGAGSTLVPRFPRLVTRLGAPATSPGDIPDAAPFDPDGSFAKFVAALVGLRLRRMVEADLAVRGGDLAATEAVAEQAARLLAELRGVAVAVDPEWLHDLVEDLEWLLTEIGPPDRPAERIASRLRGERYLALLDRLVAVARSPRLGDPGGAPAGRVADGLLHTVVDRVDVAVAAAGTAAEEDLDGDAAVDGGWAEVAAAVAQVDAVTALTGHLLPGASARLTHRLAKPRRLLARVHLRRPGAAGATPAVDDLTPPEAFAAGRAYERQLEQTRQARAAFLRAWAKARRKLAG